MINIFINWGFTGELPVTIIVVSLAIIRQESYENTYCLRANSIVVG